MPGCMFLPVPTPSRPVPVKVPAMSDHDSPDVVDVHASSPRAASDLQSRLELLSRMVAEAKAVPLSSSVMLNRAEVDGLLGDILASLPEELRQAQWVIKERDDVLESARSESARIIDEARSERSRLIAKTEVVQAANREAERIVEDARERARQIRLEAEDYVDAKLANFEVVLAKVLTSVERGREKLRGRLDADQFAADLAEADDEV
jgi:F0F1-type ATP synthase membrane subunit b/b'